jgi:hypothetical protein
MSINQLLVESHATPATSPYDVVCRSVAMDSFQMPPGASLGLVLTSDNLGHGSWQAGVPGASGPAGPTGATGPAGPTGPFNSQGQVRFTTFVVDGSGSTLDAYLTIQQAVNAANTAPYLGVQTLIIVNSFPGSYTEVVTIPANSANLHIVGVGDGLDTSGPNITGGFVNHFSATLSLENLIIFGDGVHVCINVGDVVQSPTLNLKSCSINSSLGCLQIGQNATVRIEDCSMNSSVSAITSFVSSDNSNIIIKSCELILGVMAAIDLDAGASSVQLEIEDSFIEGVNDITIKTTNALNVLIKYCSIVNNSHEDLSISATSSVTSTYNEYQSNAVSTFVATGTGNLFYFSDHASATNHNYDPGLTITPFVAVT